MHRVAVIGAGTMGPGIAQAAATAGLATCITDENPAARASVSARVEASLAAAVSRGKLSQALADAARARLEVASDLERAVSHASIVVEAIVEDLDAKRALFARLDALAPADAILATNTSSLSIGSIAGATNRPERVLGMHFFNPVAVMKLVELVVHPSTDAAVLETARQFVHSLRKTAIVVRDAPGFASSRLGVALGLEAMRMVEAGIATPADIDTAMELGYGHAMGPLRVSDLVGLDVRLQIAEYLHRELKTAHFEPPEILRRKVRAGELGKKTGKGFYDWPS